jgi:hypothetical protein
MRIGDRSNAAMDGPIRVSETPTQRNENKLLTSLYKLLTNGGHIAGMKPRFGCRRGNAEIGAAYLVCDHTERTECGQARARWERRN